MASPSTRRPSTAPRKRRVIGLAKYLATYWGVQDIRVNMFSPGGVESGQNETFQSRYSTRVPLGRMAPQQ